jgi:hypothetical protein
MFFFNSGLKMAKKLEINYDFLICLNHTLKIMIISRYRDRAFNVNNRYSPPPLLTVTEKIAFY